MKYFTACIMEDQVLATTIIPPKRILLSYFYWKNKVEKVKDFMRSGMEVFIDSGAFSAKSSGASISLNNYCAFLNEVKAPYYAGLDVIGDAVATQNNQIQMEEMGFNPIPTFHLGSTIHKLDFLLKYPYIALGGLVFEEGIENHLDLVWRILLQNNPNVKVHGFGVTNIDFLKRYPWYSIDSSSYSSFRRFRRETILWDNFNFKTLEKTEFYNILRDMGITGIDEFPPKNLYKITDYFAAQGMKTYVAFLTEINKTKDFSYITAQKTLF